MADQRKSTGLELDTRSKLLKAAVTVFGRFGFAGASVRQIADLAGVNHGLIRYHYSSKRDIWCAVVAYLYGEMETFVHRDEFEWAEMSPRDRLINVIGNYVRFHAKYPELQRIVLFETIHNSDRLDWLNDNYIRPFTDRAISVLALNQQMGLYKSDLPSMNLHYIGTAAARTVFLMASEIERNFGVDMFNEAEVEQHIQAIVGLFLTPETALTK